MIIPRRIRQLPLLRIHPVLIGLAALLVCIQVATSSLARSHPELLSYVGLSPSGFFSGKVWTLLSYALFHHPNQFSHLIVNFLLLLYFGGRITHIFSVKTALIILGLGSLAGGLTHLGYSITSGTTTTLIGISGGTFALLAALGTFARDSHFTGIKGAYLIPLLIFSSAFLLFIHPGSPVPALSKLHDIMASSTLKNLLSIGHACHLGGLVTGWAIAQKMMSPLRKTKLK